MKEALREPAIEAVEGPRPSGNKVRISRVHTEDFLTDLALLWILASIIIKLTYKGQLQARAEAAQAFRRALAASALLVGTAAMQWGVRIDPFALMVVTLVAALPSASNVALLSERFGADTGRIARIILLSTAAAFLTFSGFVAVLRG